jgi:hypothetical protein
VFVANVDTSMSPPHLGLGPMDILAHISLNSTLIK